MEIIIEILFPFLGEILLEAMFEALLGLGFHGYRRLSNRTGKRNPFLASLGHIVLGSAIGGVSLVIFPESFIHNHQNRILNLIITPVCVGLIMAGIGYVRRKKGKETIRLEGFMYGFLFAFSMAVVRYFWAQ